MSGQLNAVKKCAMAIGGIKVILIDLSGTLHIDDDPTPNAVAALNKLREHKAFEIKFVTNTSKESVDTLHKRLLKIGFTINKNEIYSTLTACDNYVRKNNLNPFYMLSDDAINDFPIQNTNNKSDNDYDSVVIGLAPDKFNYTNLDKAFNILLKGHPLIAAHEGKYFKTKNQLALGPGCFVTGLVYATNCKKIIIGKPNELFFKNSLPDNVQPENCIMIGDDLLDDIKGAMDIGMQGILVKTGKYRASVQIESPPTMIVENFADAVQWIIGNF